MLKTRYWPTNAGRLALILALSGMAIDAHPCEVKIGAVGGQTGAAAPWGLAEKAGTEFEAAWTNAQGGVQVGKEKCQVKVVSYDAQSNASGGAAASNYLASQNVHAVVGPISSPETTGFKPVAKRNGQVNFASSYVATVIGPDFPLAFMKVISTQIWGPLIVDAAKKRFNLKNVIVMGPNDQGGTDSGNALAKIYDQAGIRVSTEWYQRGTTNFAPIVTRLMMKSPDAIDFAAMPPGESAILAKQLLSAGYNGVFGKSGTGAELIINEAGGPQKFRGFYWFETIPTDLPGIKKMDADYVKLMGTQVPGDSLFYAAQIAAEQILRAISVAGTDQDGEKIAAALRQTTPESRYLGKGGWRGKTQYGINQQMAFPVGMGVIFNGKLMPQEVIKISAE